MVGSSNGESVEIAVEMSMGDGTLVSWVEADRQRSAEPDDGEGDVGGSGVAVYSVFSSGGGHQSVEHVLRNGSSIGPVRGVMQRVDDVDHSEAVVDGGMHVAAQRVTTHSELANRGVALVDRSVEHVEYDGTQ